MDCEIPALLISLLWPSCLFLLVHSAPVAVNPLISSDHSANRSFSLFVHRKKVIPGVEKTNFGLNKGRQREL